MNYKNITINERCCIANFLDLGWSIRKIAKYLNRNAYTISREIRRNSVNGKYLAHIANEIYLNNRMSCGSKGKSSNYKLIKYIEDGLNKTWSPEQIAGRLRLDYKDDKSMKAGFRTIYRWIYKNTIAKGDVKKLRRKGKSLKPKETRGKFNIGKSIKNRPKDIRKRENIGHWELDTVVSSRGKSKACLSTFVERKSRYLIAQVMDNRKSATFNLHCFKAFESISNELIKTFTVDRGKEFAGYNEIEKILNINVYFADPYASWKRGTNENTNGLLREFYPKRFDFSTITQNELDVVVNTINNRHRKCLGYKTPEEVFAAT
ncbi:IS30 family transposase [Romboutsia timonensis]|uniref:IS30 family transposase n=1 Tax=Romboutsia timonensis TaxID=1776391 RepID=UPI002A80F1E2|nr:IS30 family transposase [Romboutsia timonensis]MCI6668746.1 IS30 family transposase [Romboutsia timonensis]MDY3959005.1 IS30 family transposase [Romboutsia timonensis]